MDWFPLVNSLRVAAISTCLTFFLGIFAARFVARLPKVIKGILDCVLTLPLVLPPTVVGFFLLKLIGPLGPVGSVVLRLLNWRMTMVWYSAIFASTIVAFPLMYRTARGAFEALDPSLRHAGQTLGFSESFIFWRVVMPNCSQGILAGTVLSFARALGEYGATTMVTGYIPGRTAMISTTVYQLWREGNDALAYKWVGINLLISFIVLVSVNLLESHRARPKNRRSHEKLSAVEEQCQSM